MLYQITLANQTKYKVNSRGNVLQLQAGDQVQVGSLSGIKVTGSGTGIYGSLGAGGNAITVDGWVESGMGHAILLNAGFNTIVVSAPGQVLGAHGIRIGVGTPGAGDNTITNLGKIQASAGAGVLVEGANSKIVNTGLIQGWTQGISIDAKGGLASSVLNKGVISAAQTGAFIKDSASLQNTGDIKSKGWAIEGAGGPSASIFIHNTGKISGGFGGFFGSGAAETILNEGTINGKLWFGAGADKYSGKSGVVIGEVDLGAGNDTAEGGSGSEIFKLGHDKDSASGGSGNDVIYGGAGADTLDGGFGNDTLVGGSDGDWFVLTAEANVQFNVIQDYEKIDTIRIRGSDFGLAHLVGLSVNHIGKAFGWGSVATSKSERILYDEKDGTLYYDKDGLGGGAAVKIAEFSNKPVLSLWDFKLF